MNGDNPLTEAELLFAVKDCNRKLDQIGQLITDNQHITPALHEYAHQFTRMLNARSWEPFKLEAERARMAELFDLHILPLLTE